MRQRPFKKIFEKYDQMGHYNMMIKISEDSIKSNDTASDTQLLETLTP